MSGHTTGRCLGSRTGNRLIRYAGSDGMHGMPFTVLSQHRRLCGAMLCVLLAALLELSAVFQFACCQWASNLLLRTHIEMSHHHHHHQITKLSHSINAIGPAPHRGGRKREHRSIMFATITHIPSLHKIRRNAPEMSHVSAHLPASKMRCLQASTLTVHTIVLARQWYG
jgi:hypothetical protein